MRKLLVLAGIVAAFYLTTSSARADCGLVPYEYPLSWQVMLPHHCYSDIYYYPPRHSSHRWVRVADTYPRGHVTFRRPYLRPGWWW
jgi:hypothetical protein